MQNEQRMVRTLLLHPGVVVATLVAAAFLAGVIGPSLRHTLPWDLIEGFLWGRSFQLGYYKHPPLQAWLLGMIERLASGQWWIAFVLAQVCVAVTIWAVWKLARALLGDIPGAIAAALTLAGINYYVVPTGTFTPDTLSLPLWALMLLFYWRAVGERQPKYWYALAITIALFIYAKYTCLLLIGTLGLLTIGTSEGRAALRNPAPWFAALLCLTLASPHLVWLANHPSPLRYPLDHLPAASSIAQRFWFSAKFLTAQLLNHFPLLLLLLILLLPVRGEPQLTVRLPLLAGFANRFVLAVATLPLSMVVVLNLWSGIDFPHRWAAPLFAASPILVLMLLGPELALRRLGFAGVVALALVTVPHIANGAKSYLSSDPKPGAFPAQEAAERLTAAYRKQTGKPLRIVVGERRLAGAVALYSSDRPLLFIDGRFDVAPWITPEMIENDGALVVWIATGLPERLRLGLAPETLVVGGRIALPSRNLAQSPVVELDWAILPPKSPSLNLR